MGPIKGATFTPEQLDKLLSNENFIKGVTEVLGYDDLPAFTKTGRDIKSLTTSRAKLGSVGGEYLGAAEGKTPAQLSKELISAKNENAILRAAQELAKPVDPLPTAAPKIPPGAPSMLEPAMALLNKILTGAQLATYSGDLNTGEDERLQQILTNPLGYSQGIKP